MARHRDYRLETKMVFPGPAAADAWAGPAADHWDANLAKRRAAVRDCPWAWARDFRWVMAEPGHPVVPERPDGREWPPAPRPRDELRMDANPPVQLAVLQVERV